MNRADIGRAILQATVESYPITRAQSEALALEVLRLRSIMDEIHAWAVCGCIADADDMMQNIERVCDITAPGFEGRGKTDEVTADRIRRVRNEDVRYCAICLEAVLEGQPRYGPTGNHYDCEPHKTTLGSESAAAARAVKAVNDMDAAIERAKTAFKSLDRTNTQWRTRGRSGR
ncbi:hypothetical protein D3C87_1001810 [compost metagenome]